MPDQQTQDFLKTIFQSIIAVGSVGAAIFAYMSKKAIQEVHVSLNSRLSLLLDKTEQAAAAAGRDSMRHGDGLDAGKAGPAGPAGIQGPIGPQGQVGPAGTLLDHTPSAESTQEGV